MPVYSYKNRLYVRVAVNSDGIHTTSILPLDMLAPAERKSWSDWIAEYRDMVKVLSEERARRMIPSAFKDAPAVADSA